MIKIAIICEYNPFHNGHKEQIDFIRAKFPDGCIISIMSGNTVQRGDFSIFDKNYRAEVAVKNGSDLVVEIPFPFSCSSANQFAMAGVTIADKLGADYLCFGSESGDLQRLQKLCSQLYSEQMQKCFSDMTFDKSASSYIEQREEVFYKLFGCRLPSGGNDILGIEYLNAIEKLQSKIIPIVNHRKSPYTATVARAALTENDKEKIEFLLPNFAEILEKTPACMSYAGGLAEIDSFVLGSLSLKNKKQKSNGIQNKLIDCAVSADNFNDFLQLFPTKTYTRSRLRREVFAMLFDVSESDKNASVPYTVLLAATQRGLQCLATKKREQSLPVLTKMADCRVLDEEAKECLRLNIKVDRIFRLTIKNPYTGAENEALVPIKKPYLHNLN